MHGQNWHEAQERTREYPMRCVVAREDVQEEVYPYRRTITETLDCGHTLEDGVGRPAKRRRCEKCWWEARRS